MATASKSSVLVMPSGSFGARLVRSRETGIVVALVIMVAVLAVAAPEFRSADNLLNDARNFSFVGMVAIGEAMVMITGGIDLSVGSVWGVTAVSTAALMKLGWPTSLAIGAGLGIAALFGLFNGLCVTKLRMPPFVPTLATMSIARALALVITRGRSINDFRPDDDPFFALGGGNTAGLPNPFIIFLVMIAVAWIVLDRTVFGRQLYAIGGNEKAARLSGLEVDRLKIAVYIVAAVTAGVAGIIEVSYLSSAIANQGLGKELSVIAAAVIGGVALTGGEGTVLGIFVGTVILEVLRNGLVLLGTDAYWQGIFVGFVIIVAVFIDQVRKGLLRR